MDAASSGRDRTIAEVREKLANASDDGRAAILLPFAQQMVAEIGELELDEIDPDVALTSLGIDSIMAIELQNVLEKTIGTSVPMELFLKDLSLAGVIDQLAQLTSDDCDCAAIPAEQDAWVEGAL